jgi:hypothetical protein
MRAAACPGNRALMKPAITAPASAMPAPTPAVQPSKTTVSDAYARATVEMQSKTRAANRIGSQPNRRANHGVGSASSPIIDVIKAAPAWEDETRR